MKKSGFTLIELLIVIGILAVLVVTILVTLNPSEAQKKTRDVKRMKDANMLYSVLLQYINDGNQPTGCIITPQDCGSAGIAGKAQPCNDNWLQLDLCNYTKTIPVDPKNWISGANNGTCVRINPTSTYECSFRYWARIQGSDIEINVKQESLSNSNNVGKDGGDQEGWVEVGSNLTLISYSDLP